MKVGAYAVERVGAGRAEGAGEDEGVRGRGEEGLKGG